jgi:hypothetical protein
MTARLYKSTDASAPSLSGTVGSLVALLDAVLVNGYGSQSAAGWTKPYTATNKAVFRNSSSTGTGFYLDVDDSAPATAKEARVRGYETMSAVATGTGPFPTVAQMTSGLFLRKSTTADSTARPWYILADETVFYLFVESGDYTAPTRTTAFAFGDFYSFKASDAYRCMIIGRSSENTSTANSENFPLFNTLYFSIATSQTLTGHYLARTYTGAGGSVAFGVHSDSFASGAGSDHSGAPQGMGAAINASSVQATLGLAYPNPADNGLYMAPAYLHHNQGLRGYLKGLWVPSHDLPLGHGDTFSGTGAMSAKSFLCMHMLFVPSGSVPAQCFLETSNTWS